MPGQGRAVEREYTDRERAALGDAIRTLGDTTFDIYLNDRAYWRNIPSAVWSYKLGGYQVLKKWLSYREQKVLSRPPPPRRSPTLHQHRAADHRNSDAGTAVSILPLRITLPSKPLFRRRPESKGAKGESRHFDPSYVAWQGHSDSSPRSESHVARPILSEPTVERTCS